MPAGLLTRSGSDAFPTATASVAQRSEPFRKGGVNITAAGLFGIRTRFPFDSRGRILARMETDRCKVTTNTHTMYSATAVF